MKPVSFKTNRVLLIICIAFFMIGIRIFHIGVIQREDRMKEAEKPKLRTILVRADRGEICDRFGLPLTTNRISYNAAIYYSQINQIPSKGWSTDKLGNRVRTTPRRDHIKKLSLMLGEELHLDPERVEDLIHSKASLLPHVPFLLKTNLQEKEYYRLKMLEKDWPGLYAEIGSERHYPLGKVGCHLIGTLGSISQKEYMDIVHEIHTLQELLTEYETLGSLSSLHLGYDSIDEIYDRLETLRDKAYTLNDKVGKNGVEGQFEEDLRGNWGIKILEVDNQGKPIRELPNSKPPIAGNKIVLSISSELQQFAEELLILSEKERDKKSFGVDPLDKTRKEQKQPWIKGGSIVAIDPKTGEVLALASCPRFDPNDFVGKQGQAKAFRWLENQRMIGALWDGKEDLIRERPLLKSKKINDESTRVSWEFFLDQILPKEGPLRLFFEKTDDIKGFVHAQEDFQALLYFSKNSDPSLVMEALTTKNSVLWDTLRACEDATPHIRRLDTMLHSIPSVQDRLFAIDLCRLCIYSPHFSDDLLTKLGSMKITAYRALNQAFCRFSSKIKEEIFKEFHTTEFTLWRQNHQKEFLTQKRAQEKEKKTYARPYIDYLDQKEKELFYSYWESHGISILLKYIADETKPDPDKELLHKTLVSLPPVLAEEFIRSFRSFENLDRPILTQNNKIKTEKDLASLFYPVGSFGYCRSYGFQAGAPQGSIFKLVVAHEGLKQGHSLTIIDEQRVDPNAPPGKHQIVAYSANQTPYHRIYKGGRLPKSYATQIGKIDLIGAIEHSSNPYFAILAGDYLKTPEDLNESASLFGYGKKTGIDLQGEATGNLPKDLKTNRTGLYSYTMGQHTHLCTPLQSALMLSALANGGHLLKPQIVREIRGENHIENIAEQGPMIRNTVWFPSHARNTIFEGMDKCMWSSKGRARLSSIKSLIGNPLLMHDYLQLQHQMIGKTSTAEILYNPGRYPSSLPQMYKHIWFGSIAFQEDSTVPSITRWESAELVVVVFLRFGDAGKEAAPLGAQMIRKWREIKAKHENNEH